MIMINLIYFDGRILQLFISVYNYLDEILL